MNIQMLYAIMIFSSSLALSARTVLKSISIDYSEEKVNGVLFVYRYDLIDGKAEEIWKIDGKNVSKEIYDQEILQSELEERRIARKREYESRQEIFAFKQASSRLIYQKLLLDIANQIRNFMQKIDEYGLRPYLVFSQSTLESARRLKKLESKQLKLLDDSICAQDADVIDLQKLYEDYQDIPERLMQCLYQTVQHAIAIVDDTKQLKDLLLLISQDI